MRNAHWLTPKGEMIPIQGIGTHIDYLQNHTEHKDGTYNNAFRDGWQRVYSEGRTLMTHNHDRPPTSRQQNVLKDHAMMNGFHDIIHTNGQYDRTLWSKHDQFSHKTYSNELAIKYKDI
jgi:hypothetical protein